MPDTNDTLQRSAIVYNGMLKSKRRGNFMNGLRKTIIEGTVLTGFLFAMTARAQIPDRVAYWRAENNAVDSQGSHNGTLPPGATFVAGRNGVGYAFLMNGPASLIPIDGGSGELNLRRYTISAWIKPNAIGAVQQTIVL